MLGFSGHKIITGSIAADTTCMGTGVQVAGANHILIEVPTFAVGLITATANVYVKGCATLTGTYRRLATDGVYSAGAGLADWEAPSSIGNKLYFCQPAACVSFIKVEVSNTATAAYSPIIHLHM